MGSMWNRLFQNPRGMTKDELRIVAARALHDKHPKNRERARRVAFDAIRRADPSSGTSDHPHGVSYSHGIAEVAYPIADAYIDAQMTRRRARRR